MRAVDTASRYWHTLRHLKPVQVLGRLRFRIVPGLDDRDLPDRLRSRDGVWRRPTPRPPALLGAADFELIGVRYALPAVDGWDDPAIDHLRRYTLHYFDDLAADPPSAGAGWHGAWIARWIAENPPRRGTGWEPYPVSLRLVNWIKWLLAGTSPSAGMIASLALQARWLRRRLEWHLLGNHLFANAKALVFAGLMLDGDEADGWLATGLQIVATQIDEQCLADGGHFELSPMYHAIFLDDVLDLINAARAWPGRVPAAAVERWTSAVPAMLRYLSAMSHPDGQIAMFNDAAIGVAPDLAALRDYAERLGIDWTPPGEERLVTLSDSGYARVSMGPAVAILDVARVGPDYLPGHAHADTLSFELSLAGRRLIVNGGTSEYGVGAVRLLERGTAAHSTVEIDGANSSEVWSGFRVARRARPRDLTIDVGTPIVVACAHDGYRRLAGSPVPRRRWAFTEDGLTVDDSVSGNFVTAVARFVLASDVAVEQTAEDSFRLVREHSAIADIIVRHGRGVIAPAHHALRFGRRRQTSAIAVTLDAGRSIVAFTWL